MRGPDDTRVCSRARDGNDEVLPRYGRPPRQPAPGSPGRGRRPRQPRRVHGSRAHHPGGRGRLGLPRHPARVSGTRRVPRHGGCRRPAVAPGRVQHAADLVVLDLALRGGGTKVLTKIRRYSAVPVIVCSARDSEQDRVRLLNLGADDYVVKPVSLGELEARIRAVLRRGGVVPASAQLDLGELVIDRTTRTVSVRGIEVTMTRKEFDLLTFLASSPGQVFSREELLQRVWRSTVQWQARSTVTEHVRRVRQKIEPRPHAPRWITTVRGMGYRFSLPDAS
ncbi:MAG TPA: response regulator transcription factor [Acidimicrobiales bacterium]